MSSYFNNNIGGSQTPLDNNSNSTSPTDNRGNSNNNPANQQLYTFPFNMVGGTSSQAQGAPQGGGGFGSTPNSLGLTPMFQGHWNSNTDDQGTNNGSGYGSNNGATSHPPANANTTAQMTQGDMLSQLVANLQSQQQQQAQAQQVQAALARAFGTPGNSNSGGVDFSTGGNGIGGGTNYDFNNNMLSINHNNNNNNTNTLQGLNGMSDMNGNNSGGGIMSSYFSSGQQSNMSARDLLSRMQMLQQQTQQQLQQHQQQDNGLSSGMSGSNNSSSSSASSSNNNNNNATADELIKLQLEQEKHNRWIQLAQQDRQERAILANQDSIMKKARWGDIGENNNTNSSSATATVTDAHQTMTTLGGDSNNNTNSLFAQFPLGVPTGFTNNNIVGNGGMNVAQQFGKLSSLVESLQHKQQGGMGGMGGMGGGGGGGLVGMNNNNTLVGGMNAASAALLNPGIASLLAGAAQNLGLVDASSTMMSSLGADLSQRRSHHQAIVPCRARGMPVDHNFKTAYFVIPDGIEHGDELMCSYPACRQAGVKFRYCLECKVPVAKRNFRNRHRHGVTGEDGGEEYSSEEGEESEGVDDEQRCRICPLPEDGNSVPPLGSADGTTTNHRGGGDGDDGNDNDELYAGVKKEHIIIIPGAAAPPLPIIDGGTTTSSSAVGMKKKRKGGNIRVPCRARGMPMAHNFKTAYFMIPPTIEHGDELLCSFPSCRSAGAKFRYCLHCKLPVAKRNFRNRHKHGNMGGTDKTKNGGDLKSPKDDAKDPVEDGATTSAVARYDDDSKLPSLESGGDNANEAATIGLSNQSVTTVAGPRVCVASSQDAKKVQRWVELLESKPDPDDKDAMAVWMANLMNASSSSGGGSAPSFAAPLEDNTGSSMDVLAAASDLVEGGSSLDAVASDQVEGGSSLVELALTVDGENGEEGNLKREREEGDEEEEGGRHPKQGKG